MSNYIEKLNSWAVDLNKHPYWVKIYQESILKGPLHRIKHFTIWAFHKSNQISEYLSTVPRSLGFRDKRYEPLRALKNKYEGKRCFITCTGPSLTIDDLEKLEGEYVFGMNSICLVHDKTRWKPDFYGIQDVKVFEKLKEQLLRTDNGLVFAPYGYKNRDNTPEDWIYFPMCGSYHLYEMSCLKKYFAYFSDDCYVRVYDGYSIAYTIIQLAAYMGFSELYLIGADCTYMGKNQHFIETGVIDPGFAEATNRLNASYGTVVEYCKNHELKVFNATRGGCLELFPRVVLEDVLARQEKNKKSL